MKMCIPSVFGSWRECQLAAHHDLERTIGLTVLVLRREGRAAQTALKDLASHHPDAKKYEVAGFFWWQGNAEAGKGSIENHDKKPGGTRRRPLPARASVFAGFYFCGA
jgi:hypothetical protein